jgi:hypothetical protein
MGVLTASVEPAELEAVQRGDDEEEDDDGADADHGRLLKSVAPALAAPPPPRKPRGTAKRAKEQRPSRDAWRMIAAAGP